MPASAGSLSDFHYMVTTPVGEHIGADASPALIIQVVLDVAAAIEAMGQKGWLHRQAVLLSFFLLCTLPGMASVLHGDACCLEPRVNTLRCSQCILV
jgi:hypothetical protein